MVKSLNVIEVLLGYYEGKMDKTNNIFTLTYY